MTTAGASAFTTAERMVDRVHGDAANLGTTTQPTVTAGLAQGDVLMLDVTDLADGGEAGGQHLAHFAGGHTQQSVLAFLGDELGVGSGGAAELTAATGVQLDVVQHGTHGNAGHGQRIAGLDVGLVAGDEHIALLHAERSENIALFTVGIVQERDAGGAVGVVFDVGHGSRDVELVPLEVDDAVQTLHAAAATTARHATMIVAASLFGETFRKGLLRRGPRDFLKVGNRLKTASRRGGFQLAHSHVYTPSKNSIFSPDARVT